MAARLVIFQGQHYSASSGATKWHPGTGVGMGKDSYIFSKDMVNVKFQAKPNGRTLPYPYFP